jgi:hypothetical protein
MKTTEIKNLTPYQDVNAILVILSESLQTALGSQLVGLYLTGSLTYGDFDRGSSDIDFLTVLDHSLSEQQLEQVNGIHSEIAESFPEWAKRIEGSYITKDMLSSKNPPAQARPYVNNAKMNNYKYGNEWLINLYVLHECGVALVGPPTKVLFPVVGIQEVRDASRKDLHDDWKPKLHDPHAFDQEGYEKGHLQAYAVLTMCRILHRANSKNVASKRVASTWVKEAFPDWTDLVERAEKWHYGQALATDEEVLDFIKFTIKEVS